jgi:hypothetical protein
MSLLRLLRHFLPALCVLSPALAASASSPAPESDWPSYMAQHDLVWEKKVPEGFFKGAFLGDGVTGGMLFKDPAQPSGLRLLMGRYDIIAHTSIPKFEMCVPRLFAGDILLTPAGQPTDESLRLDLWNAESRGVTVTDKGRLEWRTYVHRTEHAFIFVVKSSGGESAASLNVREQWGIGPNFYHKKVDPQTMADKLPPKPVTETRDAGVTLITQRLVAKAAHAVAWTVLQPSPDTRILIATLGAAYDDAQPHEASIARAQAEALDRLAAVRKIPLATLDATHRAWWHAYYPKSRLDLPQDPAWQSFWWKQIYKFASASAEDSSYVMDTQGPWIYNAGWSAVWWNLNVQLNYLPAFSANRLDVGRSLLNGLERMHQSGVLSKNAGKYSADSLWIGRSADFKGAGTWGNEIGNLTWSLQLGWRYWRHTGDERIARWLFPLLKGDVNYYLHLLKEAPDGKLHLPPSRSPEYENCMKGREFVADAHYALASLRWALPVLLDLDTRLGLKDPLRPRWEETLRRLPDLPVDETGFMVGSDQPYDSSHRHYSHLLALYPYHLIDPTKDAASADLYRRSVDHWVSKPQAFAGYSYTGSAAMYATLGDAEKAIFWLDKLLPRVEANTLYTEGGGQVIETPLSAVESVNYLLLQSWGDTVRVFPAVPARWRDASFRDFSAEGAFLVSARREAGKTAWVRVFSQVGSPLKLRISDLPADAPVRLPRGGKCVPAGPGLWQITLPAGSAIEFGRAAPR